MRFDKRMPETSQTYLQLGPAGVAPGLGGHPLTNGLDATQSTEFKSTFRAPQARVTSTYARAPSPRGLHPIQRSTGGGLQPLQQPSSVGEENDGDSISKQAAKQVCQIVLFFGIEPV